MDHAVAERDFADSERRFRRVFKGVRVGQRQSGAGRILRALRKSRLGSIALANNDVLPNPRSGK